MSVCSSCRTRESQVDQFSNDPYVTDSPEKDLSDKEYERKRVSHIKRGLLWMILCLSGNITQVYHISSQYFRYGITTNVQVVIEDTIMLPTAAYCFNILQVIKWHDMTHKERVGILQDDIGNHIFDYAVQEDEETVKGIPLAIKTNSRYMAKILGTSNLQKLNMSRLFEVTYKFEEMLNKIVSYLEEDPTTNTSRRYINLTSNDRRVHEIFNIKEYIKGLHRCYLLEYNKPYQFVNHYHLARQSSTPGVVSILFFNQERLKNTLGMYYVPNHPGRKLTSGFYGALPMSSKDSQIEHATYDVFEGKLLQAPYETRCVKYSSLGFESRGECYESCIRNQSISATGMIPPSVNINRDETKQVIKLIDIMTNKDNIGTLMNRLEDICDKRCQAKDCSSVTYIPKKLAFQEEPGVLVSNLAPQSPTIRATCRAAVTLIQYLTDVASTFGFWLGISAFGFFDFVKKTIKHVSDAYLSVEEKKTTTRRGTSDKLSPPS